MTRYFSRDPQELRLSVSAVVWRGEGPVAGELLLMRRSDNGHWGLPGGHVDPGESVLDATHREVYEETGYRVDVLRLIGVYSEPERQVVEYADGRRVHSVNLCFEARALSAGQPTTPEESLGHGFFPVSELPQPFVPIHDLRVSDAVDGQIGARIR